MPVTQERMLKLIQAAESCQMNLATALETVRHKMTLIATGKMTKEQAWDEYSLEVEALQAPAGAAVVIAQERLRYNLTHNRNAFEKRRQEQKRRAMGMREQRRSEPEPYLLDEPSPLLARAARIKAEVDATDNLPDEEDLLDLSGALPPESEDEVAEHRAWRDTLKKPKSSI